MKLARIATIAATVAFALALPLGGVAGAAPAIVHPATGTIVGTVTNPQGHPVVHACVQIYSYGNAWLPVVFTNAQGQYTISGVAESPNDPYTIGVDATCAGGTDAANDAPYTSPSIYLWDVVTATVDASLALVSGTPGASITGRVLSGGVPVVGVCATALGPGAQFSEGLTASDGTYAMTNVSPGTYDVIFSDCNGDLTHANIQPVYYGQHPDGTSTPVAIAAGQQLALGDQTVLPGGEIDIKLTDASGNLLTPDVLPIIQLADTTYLGPSGGIRSSAPDVNGYWRTIGLLPRPYTISYDDCATFCRPGPIGYYPGQGVGGTATPVPVTAGGVTTLTDVVSIPPFSTSATVLTATPQTASVGQDITFTATVTDPQTGLTPTGNVEFLSNYGALGVVPLDSHGIASVTSNVLPAGADDVWTHYVGDGQSDQGGTQVTVTVTPATGGGGGGSSGGGGGGGAGGGAASGTLSAGGTFSSDGPDAVLSVTNPLTVGVQSPNAGTVTIDKTAPNTPVAHYRVLGVGATITAPAASVASPLTLVFTVFDGALTSGLDASDLAVVRDGVPITSACTGAGATPDPCIASVTTIGAVTAISVRSSHASTWDVEGAAVGRIAGANRIATAAAASQNSFPSAHAGAVVLARADDYPDALVGAPLAAVKNAPLLLTQGTALPTDTAQEIARVLPAGGTIYLLGGTAAIPASIASALTATGYQVVRYAGIDRYATAVAVADALGDPATVLLATGTNFPDALSAGPAAAHLHGAVLLTNGASLPSATSSYLSSRSTTAYAVGGPAAAADPQATAIVGVDRYATATAVANRFFPAPTTVGVATGVTFPDALAGGAQLALVGGPLLLSAAATMPAVTTGYLTSVHVGVTGAHIYGGTSALSAAVLSQLRSVVGG